MGSPFIHKLLGYLLLAIFLPLVFHVGNVEDLGQLMNDHSKSQPLHQHEDFDEVHHDHHFHIGVLHLLGHLVEFICQADNVVDEHFIGVNNSTTHKTTLYSQDVDHPVHKLDWPICKVDSESLPDPPRYLQSTSPQFLYRSTPSRAPPAHV